MTTPGCAGTCSNPVNPVSHAITSTLAGCNAAKGVWTPADGACLETCPFCSIAVWRVLGWVFLVGAYALGLASTAYIAKKNWIPHASHATCVDDDEGENGGKQQAGDAAGDGAAAKAAAGGDAAWEN